MGDAHILPDVAVPPRTSQVSGCGQRVCLPLVRKEEFDPLRTTPGRWLTSGWVCPIWRQPAAKVLRAHLFGDGPSNCRPSC